jgi:hypothetical protein
MGNCFSSPKTVTIETPGYAVAAASNRPRYVVKREYVLPTTTTTTAGAQAAQQAAQMIYIQGPPTQQSVPLAVPQAVPMLYIPGPGNTTVIRVNGQDVVGCGWTTPR